MKTNSKAIVLLNNDVRIPSLGLGTYRSAPGKETEQAVLTALRLGYRHIDTAAIYRNEESVGAAIKRSGIPREEIFITTKLWNADHHRIEAALKESLKKLGTSYVDLYLIHWPVPERNDSWEALERLYKKGLCKAIGVSNFTVSHLEQLLNTAKIVPAVNQVEFSPFLYQKELLEYCSKKGIIVEAYSPLTRGQKLTHPLLKQLEKQYEKTPAQILLRWAVQHDMVVLPKSTHEERIKENMNIFDFSISPADMKELDSLDENFRVAWDPSGMP